MVYLSISRKVKNYTKQILFASMILLNRGKNDSEKGQLTMKNKLKSCAILATLGAITIHLINKTHLREIIMTGDLEKSIIENREMVNHYCYFMIWTQKALAQNGKKQRQFLQKSILFIPWICQAVDDLKNQILLILISFMCKC